MSREKTVLRIVNSEIYFSDYAWLPVWIEDKRKYVWLSKVWSKLVSDYSKGAGFKRKYYKNI